MAKDFERNCITPSDAHGRMPVVSPCTNPLGKGDQNHLEKDLEKDLSFPLPEASR